MGIRCREANIMGQKEVYGGSKRMEEESEGRKIDGR